MHQTLWASRRANIPHTTRTMIAPTVAPISPAPSPAWYHPIACPRKVATKAPAIPSRVVRTKPEGSLGPGCSSFAMTPATKPMMIVQSMPIMFSNLLQRTKSGVLGSLPAKRVLLTVLAVSAATLPGQAAGIGSACGDSPPIRCEAGLFCETRPGSCGNNALGSRTCARKPRTCTADYNPVCGCNNKTYSNDCERRYAGASKKHDGKCQAKRPETSG